jgi:hypothetical protein
MDVHQEAEFNPVVPAGAPAVTRNESLCCGFVEHPINLKPEQEMIVQNVDKVRACAGC